MTGIPMENHSEKLLTTCKDCGAETEELPWFPELTIKLVCLSLLSVLATLANVLLIYLSSKSKSPVSNTKVFIISLSASHLLGSVIVIPIWVVTRLLPETASRAPFCDIASFVWFLMVLSSFYSLSAISLDRYFIISDPMHYPLKATTRRKMVVLVIVWIGCVVFASTPISGWGHYQFQPSAIPICGLDWNYSISYSVFLIVVGFLIPILVDVVSCTRILTIARAQSSVIEARKSSFESSSSVFSRDSHPVHPHKLLKLKHKLNSLRLVFAGTGTFLICWLPYLTANMWLVMKTGRENEAGTMPYLLEFSVMFVALTNGLVNPVVIIATHRDYKKRVKYLLYVYFGLFREHVLEEMSDFDSSLVRKSDIRGLYHVFHKMPSTNLNLHVARTCETDLSSIAESQDSQSIGVPVSDKPEPSIMKRSDSEVSRQCGNMIEIHGLVIK